jgi:hypothetical protein
MNCQTIRSRILALPDPAQVPEPLAGHLTGCSGCTAWHQLLVKVEVAVATAPVPATDGTAKARVVAQFRSPSKSKPKAPALVVSPRNSFGAKAAKLWPAGLIAAAILVGTVAYLTFDRRPGTTQVAALPPDTLLAKVTKHKIDLDAAAHDPNRKVRILTEELEDIHESAQALARVSPGAEMDSHARMFKDVGEAMVAEGKKVDLRKDPTVLNDCIQALVKIEQAADKKATEAPVESIRPLREIAKAARENRIAFAQAKRS